MTLRQAQGEAETPWEGKYLAVRKRGSWEWVERKGEIGAAVIVAIDDRNRLVLVEQERTPVGRRCLELPAGLVGDDSEGESLEDAARRELEEETGYRAERIEALGEFFSSPGMMSESFTVVRATGLTRSGDGGGAGDEDITVHHVPLADVAGFVREKRAAGLGIDGKILLVLNLADI